MIITLHYTETLIKRAVKRYCWSQVGLLYVLAMLLVLFGLVSAIVRHDTSWLTGVLATVLLIGLALPMVMYRVQMSGSLARFRALASQPATLTANLTSFVIQSVAGSNTLPWRTITAIRRYDDLWLLMLDGGGFMTVPLDRTTTAEQDYLIDRVRAHGGKIV